MSLSIPALERLLEYGASGIGSVAGPLLAPLKARRESQAKLITAECEARVIKIRAEAHSKARAVLLPDGTEGEVSLTLNEAISERIQFQEEKRQANVASILGHAAENLRDKTVFRTEPDHDWAARFFGEVQDVSSEEMQQLWGKVLAGQVEREGSTSLHTLQVLKNLDQTTARLFAKLCSMCVYLPAAMNPCLDARVPSLGGNAASNALSKYGLVFTSLNRLEEHGLIISDYNSWQDYRVTAGLKSGTMIVRWPFRFQRRNWVLLPASDGSPEKDIRLHGVSLTQAGRELSRVVEMEAAEQFSEDLRVFLHDKGWVMEKVTDTHESDLG